MKPCVPQALRSAQRDYIPQLAVLCERHCAALQDFTGAGAACTALSRSCTGHMPPCIRYLSHRVWVDVGSWQPASNVIGVATEPFCATSRSIMAWSKVFELDSSR